MSQELTQEQSTEQSEIESPAEGASTESPEDVPTGDLDKDQVEPPAEAY